MDPIALTIGLSWIAGALVISGTAIPLLRGRVPRNDYYGVRFPQSLQSDDAWFAINRFGARRMIAWSTPMLLAGLAALFLPLQSHPGAAVFIGLLPLAFILLPLLQTYFYARWRWPVT